MSLLLKIALSEYGQEEIIGENDNKRILQYSEELGANFDLGTDDEVPWCSTFINWCSMKAGVERSDSAVARSWLKVGVAILEPQAGDIVIFKRGNSTWQGHVGIYINHNGRNMVRVLGGNQNNRVQISENYKNSSVLGYVRLRPINKN